LAVVVVVVVGRQAEEVEVAAFYSYHYGWIRFHSPMEPTIRLEELSLRSVALVAVDVVAVVAVVPRKAAILDC
jgi:hypothetical protein